MLTKYEEHLFESLGKVQDLLHKATDDNDRLKAEVKKLKDDDNNWYKNWGTANEKNKVLSDKVSSLEKLVASLESQLAEKNEESDAATSNSSYEEVMKEAI